MITISLCMIVKNEQSVIGRCLDTVADLVDELIIVDTGSTDDTASVVKQFGAQEYSYAWNDDFAAARNYAFQQASKDYILWLDADDVIEQAEREKLRDLKHTLDPEVDAVSMLYLLSKDEFDNVTFSLRRNRLVRRTRNFRWIGAVHEYMEVGGRIVHSDIAVTHLGAITDKAADRNLRIYKRLLEVGKELSPRDMYYYANELKDHGFHRQAIMHYESFLNGGKGWVEDNISACCKLADCYHALGDRRSELESVLRSLQYDLPRSESCCRLGYYFLEQKNYHAAITWYTLAIESRLPDGHLGFVNPTFATWLPHLQLSVCYDRIGQYERARLYNERALAYRPGDPRMLQNRAYFQSKLENPTLVSAGATTS
ncbi:glycosyltransferase [Cohnella sp. JJ-181]|uniref:glycosyltransferase n=1 Tax=Cohnella rhizoplanae TaxID=2974897 RepID=UPI0022FFC2A2|nr:glycosyltransferase family 2 protein [Cohnella sp. JJ-181]CAI6085449.1 hypothetical protein COHCIP112018_04675 [Cohnella sp. JJ-181]